jgi:aldo/keto reductase family protein
MGMSALYGPADDAESIATIQEALDAGVNLLDTGDYYGAGHVQHEQDPLQRLPVRQPLPTRVAEAPLHLRAAAARSVPTAHPRRSTARRPSAPLPA